MKKLVLHNWSDKQAEAVVDIITTIGNKVETAEVSFNQACPVHVQTQIAQQGDAHAVDALQQAGKFFPREGRVHGFVHFCHSPFPSDGRGLFSRS